MIGLKRRDMNYIMKVGAMNYTRGAVFKHRHRALETMKEILKEKK